MAKGDAIRIIAATNYRFKILSPMLALTENIRFTGGYNEVSCVSTIVGGNQKEIITIKYRA